MTNAQGFFPRSLVKMHKSTLNLGAKKRTEKRLLNVKSFFHYLATRILQKFFLNALFFILVTNHFDKVILDKIMQDFALWPFLFRMFSLATVGQSGEHCQPNL